MKGKVISIKNGKKKYKKQHKYRFFGTKKRKAATITCISLLLIVGLTYGLGFLYFSTHLYPQTEIGGVPIKEFENKQITDDKLKSDINLVIKGSDGYYPDGEIPLKDAPIDFTATYDDIKERALKEQKPVLWFYQVFKTNKLDPQGTFDVNQFNTWLNTYLDSTKPADEYLSGNLLIYGANGVEKGTQLPIHQISREYLSTEIQKGIIQGKNTITLKDSEIHPGVEKMDKEKKKNLEIIITACNELLNTKKEIVFRDDTDELTLDVKKSMLSYDVNTGKLVMNESGFNKYYETYSTEKNKKYKGHGFKYTVAKGVITKTGEPSPSYLVDQENMKTLLSQYYSENLKTPIVLTPKEESVAQITTYNNTEVKSGVFIEVDIPSQTLYAFENGVNVLTSKVVTGNESQGHGTPSGIFRIWYKKEDDTLDGQDYSVPVDYWMPLKNGNGVGFHDADWRSSFGGNIYLTAGSHGCINMPDGKAKILYGYVNESSYAWIHR